MKTRINGKMIVGKMIVGKMIVGKMIVGKMIVGKMIVGKAAAVLTGLALSSASSWAVEHQLGTFAVSSLSSIGSSDTFDIIDARGTINMNFFNSSTADFNISGQISESNGSGHELFFSTGTGSAAGARFILSGDNTYTGGTLIGTQGTSGGPIIVRAASSNALGTGAATITISGGGGGSNTKQTNALELSGGVTISNKSLLLQGSGFQGKGSLNSVDGDNTWSGTIDLRNYADTSLKPTIGVESGKLTVSGVVSGTSASGLTKVGAGTLVLEAANTYTTGTHIQEGTLMVANAGALGSGSVDVAADSRLMIGAGTSLEVSALEMLTSSARLAFELNGDPNATGLHVLGEQSGAGTYSVDISLSGPMQVGRYTLMNVSGSHEAANFVLGNVPNGFVGGLDWSNGVLALDVTAVPEPSTVAIIMGGGLLLASYHKLAGNKRRSDLLEVKCGEFGPTP